MLLEWIMISIIDALGFVVVTAVGSFLFGRLYERINLGLDRQHHKR